jgi:hypothetical protein
VILRSALAAGLLCVTSESAQAYSDGAAFATPVLEAGGGGRFYTGSPAEGYGCETCHEGGEAPTIKLDGLPTRYVPRATYELRLTWPAALEHAAAALELTDEQGAGAGSLALPAADSYLDEESCEPKEVGLLASQLYAADRDRTIAATPDCGASMLRVQWTAPARSVGPIWLAGSVLASNHDGNFTGDGVRNIARVLPAFGAAKPEVVSEGGGCSSVGSASAHGDAVVLSLVTLLLWLRRSQRRLVSEDWSA